MSTQAQLDPADRDFFEVVAATAFCNPFSEQRSKLDAQLVGHPVDPLQESPIEELTHAVSDRIRKLEQQGLGELRRHAAKDRPLMQTVFLFEVYHQFCGDFDALILDQVREGSRSMPVKFAGDALARMKLRGIGATEAARFFAIFYQLRRAFHFIVRGLIGQSRSMSELRRHLWNNVFTRDVRLYERFLWNRMEDFSTLLLGETGTGKGTAAAAMGRSGYIPFDERQGRFSESFMRGFTALNLSQFAETLIESELFGHRKGAFTGAVEAHEGVLARCSPHGSIFLDEIGEVSAPVQIKLLQVLQERTFCPVGSHEPLRFRGRVIAATNRPLEVLRARGLMRDDFFYRLSSDIIHVPPLRQRLHENPDELRQLLDHVLTRIVGEPSPELLDMIQSTLGSTVGNNHPWPGNVRELEQAVRRILIAGDYASNAPVNSPDLLGQLSAAMEAEALDADGLLAGYGALLYENTGSYEAVARKMNLDARTAKKYVHLGRAGIPVKPDHPSPST